MGRDVATCAWIARCGGGGGGGGGGGAHVSRRSDEDVRGFNVTVDDAMVVEVAHGLQHLREVQRGRVLLYAAARVEHGGEIPARHELESEEDVLRRAEAEEALDQEVRRVREQDVLLDDQVHLRCQYADAGG